MAFFDKQGKNYFAKQQKIHGMQQFPICMRLKVGLINYIIIKSKKNCYTLIIDISLLKL